ncbi:MAG TPA: metallophosphoesterase [Sphingobium sp.]
MNRAIVRRFAAAGCALLLSDAALAGGETSPRPLAFFTLMSDHGPVARAIMDGGDACPVLATKGDGDDHGDGKTIAMVMRAEPANLPLRPTKSTIENSKPSRFPVRVCEADLPLRARTASIAGHALPLPAARVRRIIIIGDTGCRIKASDNAVQDCNVPAAWPFASIAKQAAAWKPDLVLHVGDYLYRENPCPAGHDGCAATPWGYGWDAWNADFFTPALPLLAAAPWIMVRGNHESCLRAGQGWWRFLAAQALVPGQDCNAVADDVRGDQSPPYAVPLGKGAQIIAMDLAIAGEEAIPATDPRHDGMIATQADVTALAKGHRYTFLTDHYPLLGLTATRKDGAVKIKSGNKAILSTFGIADPSLALPGIDMLLAGHVHEWQQVDFRDHPGQFISGMAGTQEDVVAIPTDKALGAEPAPGTRVTGFDSWTGHFGFMTLERTGARRWTVQVHALGGQIIHRCRIDGRHSSCTA